MADAADSKSADGDIVRVQVPPSAPIGCARFYGRIKYRGVAQFGSALGSGPRGRWFKSSHLDQSGTSPLAKANKRGNPASLFCLPSAFRSSLRSKKLVLFEIVTALCVRLFRPRFARPYKSSHLDQKRFHSRYNFGNGILLYIRKIPHFRPFTAHFGGFMGIFSYINDKSAILCPVGTEVADFVSFKSSIVQGINLQRNIVL